jgi:dCTP deaminase
MEQERRSLVRCKVSRGFFESELLVIVAESSAYVNRDNVKTTGDPASGEADGFVSAYVIERSGDRTLIELPGQPVVGGARTWVPTSFLSAATA